METWRKVSGKHHTTIGGKRVVIGPGSEDGDTMQFPVGVGPENSNGSWVLVTKASPEEIKRFEMGNHPLQAVHVGRGKYNVVRSDTGEKINSELLTKEEAAQMVADCVE